MAKSGPTPTSRKGRLTRPAFYECGCCGYWHRKEFAGDCREDAERFTSDQLDTLFPDRNGDGWPDWIEVDEC